MLKQILIPMAAFAVTVTGASAFNSDMLDKLDIDLTDTQVSALEEAHELRVEGADREEVKEILEDAGIDRDTMRGIHEAAREYRHTMHEEVRAALDAEDYDAYKDAVADTPRADPIDSEADFLKLVEAHELREAGDHDGAREIMEGLDFERPEGRGFGKHRGGEHEGRFNRGE